MKSALVAPIFVAAAGLAAPDAHAQSSSVRLGGTLDLAVRHSNHQGASGSDGFDAVQSGGVTPSRLWFNIYEDLGNGLGALGYLDTRITADDGAIQAGPFFLLSFVGVQSAAWGRLTLGRQYNVLFDATIPAFKYFGPYLNTYKPEASVQLGSVNDNQVKYRYASGSWAFELQASAAEGLAVNTADPTTLARDKSWGAMLRYESGPVVVSGAALVRKDAAGHKAKGQVLAASYTRGPWLFSVNYGRNTFDAGYNTGYLIIGQGAGENLSVPVNTAGSAAAPATAALNMRSYELFAVGGSVDVTPQIQVGAHAFHTSARYRPAAGARDKGYNGVAVLGSYSLSKRTRLYADVEYTSLRDGSLVSTPTRAANMATRRTVWMTGIRHDF